MNIFYTARIALILFVVGLLGACSFLDGGYSLDNKYSFVTYEKNSNK